MELYGRTVGMSVGPECNGNDGLGPGEPASRVNCHR